MSELQRFLCPNCKKEIQFTMYGSHGSYCDIVGTLRDATMCAANLYSELEETKAQLEEAVSMVTYVGNAYSSWTITSPHMVNPEVMGKVRQFLKKYEKSE